MTANPNDRLFKTGEVYTKNVDSVEFDEKIIKFNENKSDAGYDALLKQIKEDGQSRPIYIRNGRCGDGRHRTKACKELGIDVKCIDIIDNLDDKTYIRACNTDSFTGRNDNNNQLAIKAYKMVSDFGYKDREALDRIGLKHSVGQKLLASVRWIIDNGHKDIIEAVAKGDSYKVVDKDGNTVKVSSSLRALRTAQESIDSSDEVNNIPNEDKAENKIDYNALIYTAYARDKFWMLTEHRDGLDVSYKMELIDILNIAYPKKQ